MHKCINHGHRQRGGEGLGAGWEPVGRGKWAKKEDVWNAFNHNIKKIYIIGIHNEIPKYVNGK